MSILYNDLEITLHDTDSDFSDRPTVSRVHNCVIYKLRAFVPSVETDFMAFIPVSKALLTDVEFDVNSHLEKMFSHALDVELEKRKASAG